jgi:serine/threonine-protein kinase
MDMVVRHMRDTPVPPSQRAEVAVPAQLEELVLAGLAKAPDDRPQSMAELIARLDAIEVPRAWDESRAAEWWKLHRPLETDRVGAEQIA